MCKMHQTVQHASWTRSSREADACGAQTLRLSRLWKNIWARNQSEPAHGSAHAREIIPGESLTSTHNGCGSNHAGETVTVTLVLTDAFEHGS